MPEQEQRPEPERAQAAARAQWERAVRRPWWRRHPETVILAAFVIAVAVAIALRSKPATPAAATPQLPLSAAPAVDLPQFDQPGDPACAMHYASTDDGAGTITRFTIGQPGELVAHVSGPDGTHRTDQQVTANYWAFTYPVPPGQVTDMGAVLYEAGGAHVACSIGPGTTAP